MFRKSYRAIVLERKRKRCSAMRAAKERKRMERGSTLFDCGGIQTSGILGNHSIRILSYGEGGRHYAITLDGQHRNPKTERGIIRALGKMVFKSVTA